MSDIILKTENLTKNYGGLQALRSADFELKAGEHVAIMGDNGAGKSTFVRQITAVGSSIIISFEAKVAERAMATHWRCPPDILRMLLFRF